MSLKDLTVSKIYFYLVSFISLIVILFNTQFVLTTVARYFVFKTTQEFTYQPPFFVPFMGPVGMVEPVIIAPPPFDQSVSEQKNKELLELIKQKEELKPDQKDAIDQWFRDYEQWKKNQANNRKRIIDSVMGNAISLLVFTPVFFYHFKKAREK